MGCFAHVREDSGSPPTRPWTGMRHLRNGRLKLGVPESLPEQGGLHIELAALARLAAGCERRSGNRKSMCPYKHPYNSGTTWIRLLPSRSVMGAPTCGKLPVGYCPAPSFPACFRFPKPCAKVRILPGALRRRQ